MASYAAWAARWRVPMHFLLAAVVLWFARPTQGLLAGGVGLILIGLAVRAWAAGHLRRDIDLTLSGPYAHLRHPLYFGSAFILAGFALASGRAWLAALLALYFLLLFVPTLRREERERHGRAPELFAAYRASVPALLPRLRPAKIPLAEDSPQTARFDPQLYLRNQEWRALAGCAVVLALLYGKILWR